MKRLKEGNLDDDTSIRLFFNAVLETNELCSIHQGFRSFDLGEIFKRKLRFFCDGPEEYFPEGGKTNYARDYGFELAICSEFAFHGFPVETSLESADVTTSFNGKKWFIECKRPRKKTSVRVSTKDAYSQLKKAFKKCEEPSFGAVAISMTKASMEELKIAHNATHQDAKTIAMESLEQIVSEYSKQLRALDNRVSNIVGLIFRLILPYWDFNIGEYGTYTGHAVVPFYPNGTDETETFRGIARVLSDDDLEIRQYK